MKNFCTLSAAMFLVFILSGSSKVSAGILISMQETGGDVVFAYQGSLDISGLSFDAGVGAASQISPSRPAIYFAGSTGTSDRYSNSFNSVVTFGSGSTQQTTLKTGDAFGLVETWLSVPTGYNSGDEISGTMTFESTDFASLGLNTTSAPYVWTLNNTAADTITLQVVPEPSTCILATLANLIACFRRRKV